MNSLTSILPTTNCAECGALFSPASTEALCPRCLLQRGLASGSTGRAGARELVPPPQFPFDFGGWRVLRLLGRGGMGAVYEAEQRDTGRRVALKVLGQAIDSPDMRKRFLREGRLAASVNHPNSVYIFGTEEIDGAPVIAMELVAGGTLKDALRKKPLPSREAVDAILQIIDGLEAAHAGGVLHRDVKPANCFVSPDGTVKVGDFGLSVSTLARADSQLTASGVMLGTPSYAPPEQLRGDELDVRADIYSVGATLYSLLTGRAPFEADNAVQVVAAVLDKPAPVVSGVPAGLAQIVSRCLAKKRDDRYADYAALREALIPFSSQAAEAAPIGLRFVASVIDELLVCLPSFVWLALTGRDVQIEWMTTRTSQALAVLVLYFALRTAYYAVCEGWWGAGLGKMICGLRVVRPGHGAPGLLRAAARVLIFMTPEMVGHVGQAILTTGEDYRRTVDQGAWAFSDGVWLTFLLLFVTMRQRNGWATVHDLVTGTRVIVRAKSTARPRLAATTPELPAEGTRLGPFVVGTPLSAPGWFAGYDDVLRRHIWIRRGASAVSEARRDVARAGRLRWLAGGEARDAFDAPAGCALLDLPAASRPWSAVRHWLADLALEADAAAKGKTLPASVGLEHVWLTANGRAVLLDEPFAAAGGAHFQLADPAELQRFLDAVAARTLDRTDLPLHAGEFLARLATGAFDRASFIAGNLHALLARPAVLTRRRRLASLLLGPGLVAICCAIVAFLGLHEWKRTEGNFRLENPEERRLPDALRYYAEAKGNPLASWAAIVTSDEADPKMADPVGRWVSHRYGEFISRADFNERARHLSERERDLARQIVQTYPGITREVYEAADVEVGSLISDLEKRTRLTLLGFGPLLFVVGLCALAVINLFSATIFGTSLGLRIFGLAVVDLSGARVSRGRHLARNLLAFGLIALFLPVITLWAALTPESLAVAGVLLLGGGLGVILLGFGCIFAVIWPSRGWHDRLAGTRLVLR